MARFSSIGEIPKALRKVGSGNLTLEQAEDLINRAQAGADDSDEPFSAVMSRLKRDFEQSHTLQAGFWIPNKNGGAK